MVPFSVFNRRPKIALVALKVKSVTPTVNVVGAAGASGTGGVGAGVVKSPSAFVADGAGVGAVGAALGQGFPLPLLGIYSIPIIASKMRRVPDLHSFQQSHI